MKIPVLYQIEKWIKKTFRHGNKIILVKNNKEKELKIWQRPFFRGFGLKIKGLRNTIVINEPYQFDWLKNKGKITILSNDNKIVFEENSGGCPLIFIVADKQYLHIGKNTVFNFTKIDMLSENQTIEIGENCMFSNCHIMNGDGHSVVDKISGKTLNIPEKSLKIGNHVWIGSEAKLTKNTQLPDDCIVAMGSVVSKAFTDKSIVIAGNPAKIVKTGVTWNYSPPGYALWEFRNNKRYEIKPNETNGDEIYENTNSL